ncbi:hypothetical protein OAT11_05500 [Nitrospinaceae bacterium]|jgi:hypothetical protein|nr:hypothetical protein [Nitrospinaceae bacterium]
MDLSFLRPYFVENKIRAGRMTDGGYVLEENSLKDVDVVYSYGSGWEISFEKAICQATGKTCRIFDPTLLDCSNITKYWERGVLHFFKFLVAALLWQPYIIFQNMLGYRIRFYNEGIDIKGREKYNSFQNHITQFGDQDKNIFLKIDIEGDEYKIFEEKEFLAALQNVTQLAIEFHNLEQNINELQDIILSIGSKMSLIHIHGNNWDGMFVVNDKEIPLTLELTFLANQFLQEKKFDQREYPLPKLDFPNKPSLPDINLSQLTSRF